MILPSEYPVARWIYFYYDLEVTDDNGFIDRKALGSIVFPNTVCLTYLKIYIFIRSYDN